MYEIIFFLQTFACQIILGAASDEFFVHCELLSPGNKYNYLELASDENCARNGYWVDERGKSTWHQPHIFRRIVKLYKENDFHATSWEQKGESICNFTQAWVLHSLNFKA